MILNNELNKITCYKCNLFLKKFKKAKYFKNIKRCNCVANNIIYSYITYDDNNHILYMQVTYKYELMLIYYLNKNNKIFAYDDNNYKNELFSINIDNFNYNIMKNKIEKKLLLR